MGRQSSTHLLSPHAEACHPLYLGLAWQLLLMCLDVSFKQLGQRAIVSTVAVWAAITTALSLVFFAAVAPAHAQSAGLRAGAVAPLTVGDREALVFLPHDYDPALTYPVMLVFGGYGASPEDMASTSGLHDFANAIVAYARGTDNTWAGAPYSAMTMEEDIHFARDIVDELSSDHLVDRSRVYAIGHSNGGAFAIALACRAPDLVTGAVSVSGMFYEGIDADCADAPVPVLFLYAANDDVAVPTGGHRHGAPFESVGAVVDRWAGRNGCLPGTSARWTSAVDGSAHVANGCLAETEFVLSDTAGHQWPSYAAQEAWHFLSRQVG